MKDIIKLGYCPTRRDVFSTEEAMKFNEIIRKQMNDFPVEVIDLEGINEEKLLFADFLVNVIKLLAKPVIHSCTRFAHFLKHIV